MLEIGNSVGLGNAVVILANAVVISRTTEGMKRKSYEME